MEIATRNNSTIVVTNHGKPSGQGITANSFSKLLLQFEDFVASTDNSSVARSASSSNRPPPGNLNTANHLAQVQQQQQCYRKQQPVGNSKMQHQFNKFGDYPTQHKNGLRSMLTSSTKNTYSRRSSQGSPTSTHSSPILYTSSSTQSSPILPSSTHSSPILHTPQSPSPPHTTPSSQIPHVPPSMLNGVGATASTNSGQGNLAGLASKRDPVTNKIVIKTLTNQKKDKDLVPGTSKSVIAQKPTSSRVPRKSAEPVKGQSGVKRPTVSSAPFSLPPLSVKSSDNQKQETLPDLLKPKNLAKYVQASAPKRKSAEKNHLAISILLDHDYSRSVPEEEKPVEKKLKRTFIIPKKKAGSSMAAVDAEAETQDNLEVVDMECSDTENDGGIIEDDSSANAGAKNDNKEPSLDEVADTPGVVDLLLYGRDTFRTECKLIDEEAELRYINELNYNTSSCLACNDRLGQTESDDLIDSMKSAETPCILGYNEPQLTTVSWWEEIEEILKSASPDNECSAVTHSPEEENELMVVSDAAAAIDSFLDLAEIADPDIVSDLQQPGFFTLPIDAAENSDSSFEPNNLYLGQLDVKEEIVECSTVSEVVETTEELAVVDVPVEVPTVTDVSNLSVPQVEERSMIAGGGQVVGGVRYVSLLDVIPQSASETSDTGSISSDDSKENMLDKVPAYILTSGRLGTKKNVLQRLNIKQDSEAGSGDCNGSWDDSSKKYALSPDSNSCSTSNGYESGSPSTSEFSEPHCRTRSPSPDYTRKSYSSRLSCRESHHKRSDRHRQRQGRSRSRSPIYSNQPSSRARRQRHTEKNDEEEQRRVVYVGKLPNNFTNDQLTALFRKHGAIEKVSLHFRSGKDNYGFVTFIDKVDATRCLEVTNQNPNFPFEVCYGGRREFCKEEYADLDGITEQQEEFGPVLCRNEEASFEQLLRQYSRDRRH